MKKLIYTFVIVLVVSALNAQWVQVPSGTIENLNDIQFVDANTGFAVGNAGVLLMTTNGGVNWVLVNTNSTFNNLSIYFLNSSTGYISNANQNILYTTNGGVNFITMNSYGNNFTSLYFMNQLTGFATSNHIYYALYKTTNGGNNWVNYPYGYCKSIRFLNSTFGYFVHNDWDNGYEVVRTTTNSGATWDYHSVYSHTISVAHLNSVHFISTTIGYTVGDSGKIYKTLNGGNNWTSQSSNTTNNLKSIKSIDINKAIIVGSNGIIKATNNGGMNWVNQNSTTSNNLNSLFMVNSTTGFIAGDIGTILKTTNGGVWVKKIEEIIPQNYELQQNYPNPFNPSTTIRFSIPKQDFVKITIYNVNGKLISTPVENVLSAGTYETTFDASGQSSGVYYVKFEAGHTSITKKMSLLK